MCLTVICRVPGTHHLGNTIPADPTAHLQDACIDLLIACGRLPEAAFFARTYAPSRMTEVVKLWQGDLAKINPKAAESLANPDVSAAAACCGQGDFCLVQCAVGWPKST